MTFTFFVAHERMGLHPGASGVRNKALDDWLYARRNRSDPGSATEILPYKSEERQLWGETHNTGMLAKASLSQATP